MTFSLQLPGKGLEVLYEVPLLPDSSSFLYADQKQPCSCPATLVYPGDELLISAVLGSIYTTTI